MVGSALKRNQGLENDGDFLEKNLLSKNLNEVGEWPIQKPGIEIQERKWQVQRP